MFIELLSLNLGDYFEGVDFPIGPVVLVLTVALVVFFLLYSLFQSALVTLVKQLLRAKATGEESAKTLAELHLDKSFFIRSVAMKNQGRAAHLLKKVEPESADMQTKVRNSDLSAAKFYLATEEIESAKFLCEQKSSGLLGTILLGAAVLAVGLLLFFFLPDILSFLARVLASK